MPYVLSIPLALVAGAVSHAAYQGSLVELNPAVAHADIGMAVCAGLMAVTFLAASALISRSSWRLTLS